MTLIITNGKKVENTNVSKTIHIIDDLLYKDEVYAIMGAAFETHKELGSGFLESVYQEALEYELRMREIPFVSQPNLQIKYKDLVLSRMFKADLVAYDKIIIEIKAIDKLSSIDDAQILNYLKATQIRLGLLLNFGSAKLEWRRRVLSNRPLA
jgi:GxxExxY protein